MADRSNGDVLMLEAPLSYGSRSTNSDVDIIDALPYVDDNYSDFSVKIEVDCLVEEEMRRSSKKPVDFLKDFPPLPTFNFEEYPMIGREYERMRAGYRDGGDDALETADVVEICCCWKTVRIEGEEGFAKTTAPERVEERVDGA